MTDKEKYPNVTKVMWVNEKTILAMIEDSKNNAIKHIMRIVENHIDPGDREYKYIRSVVLDELNDVSREFKGILEKILKDT
jgi:hypothetical protein